ncbi:thap domain-containing protein 9 [Holotrichia oblita]|uniref:Thap domain-containing protein 9 n=1 Tax=Holotrichia oblita TaxID=644536 RepID=A0ACB9TYY6_HOLOL|nr:thap domain-containing protein 9 [Holotrichia oblita]
MSQDEIFTILEEIPSGDESDIGDLSDNENDEEEDNIPDFNINDLDIVFVDDNFERNGDKILALSLMKQSAKGYRLLRKIFALPCRSTLIKLQNSLPFTPGINNQVVNTLKESVRKLKNEKDKHCIFIYDEMSLDVGLSYNRKCDSIDGFQDFGNGNRTQRFADHALVFMARGVHKKWKQPISYYFTQGGMNAVNLKVFVVETIKMLRSIGLLVVATVCDQLATNTAVYSALRNETNEYCLTNNIENRYFGFCVDGEEQFYELDVGDEYTKMCNKLNDTHIYKDKIKKMKVNLAAQVFSRSVSSVMRGLVRLGKCTELISKCSRYGGVFII